MSFSFHSTFWCCSFLSSACVKVKVVCYWMDLTCSGLCSLWGATGTDSHLMWIMHVCWGDTQPWITEHMVNKEHCSLVSNTRVRSDRTCSLSASKKQEAVSTLCMVQLQSSSPQDTTNWAPGHLTERTKHTGSHEIQITLPRFRQTPSIFLFLGWEQGKHSGHTPCTLPQQTLQAGDSTPGWVGLAPGPGQEIFIPTVESQHPVCVPASLDGHGRSPTLPQVEQQEKGAPESLWGSPAAGSDNHRCCCRAGASPQSPLLFISNPAVTGTWHWWRCSKERFYDNVWYWNRSQVTLPMASCLVLWVFFRLANWKSIWPN